MHEGGRDLDADCRSPAPGFSARETFTTAGLGASQALEAWHRYMGEVYFKLEIDPGTREAIDGRLSKRAFEQLEVSGFQSGRQRVRRSKRSALADRVEAYCVVFPTAGRFVCRQHGRESAADSRDIYILNASETFEVDVADGSGLICLTVPCDLLRTRVAGIDDLCGAGGFADPVMISTIRHLATQALAEDPRIDAARLQDLCLEMIELMVRPGARRVPHAEAVADGVFRKAAAMIGEHCADGSFDLASAAAACGVSRRRLQAAMAFHGTTFGRELMAARLRRASRMLKSPFEGRRQIGEIAADCGFTSQAHFANRYRERFGRCPSDERRGDREVDVAPAQ